MFIDVLVCRLHTRIMSWMANRSFKDEDSSLSKVSTAVIFFSFIFYNTAKLENKTVLDYIRKLKKLI